MSEVTPDATALVNHLATSLAAFYRGDAIPSPEAFALAKVETLSAALEAAARELDAAADAIRFGKATPQMALRAHQAARQAWDVAEGRA